jgi:hypothetical protein
MEPHKMFQDILLAEYHGTFHDTPSNKMQHLGAYPLKQVWMSERRRHQFMFAHKSVLLIFEPTCFTLYGENPIFPMVVTGSCRLVKF